MRGLRLLSRSTMTRANRIMSGARLVVLAPLLVGCGPVQADPIPTPAAAQSRRLLGQVVSEIGKNVWVVFQDSRGHHWFGTDGTGVIRYDGKTLVRFSTDDGLPNHRIREIMEDKAGKNFLPTLEGIWKFDGERFTLLEIVEDDHAWRLLPDDVWFQGATITHGPYRYDSKTLSLLKFPKGDLEDQIHREFPRSVVSPYSIYTIYQDTKGNLGMTSNATGVWRFDGEEMKNFPIETSKSWLISITFDRDGKIWLATDSAGVFRWDGQAFEKFEPQLAAAQ